MQKEQPIKLPAKKPRNHFVPVTKTRGGAGKHKNKKKEVDRTQPKLDD